MIDENKVFRAVVELLVSRGYAGMATKEVARSAGVNEATLFRRYGSKAGLVVAAVRDQLRDVPLRHVHATNDLEGDLVRLVEAYLETHRRVGAIIPLLLVETPRHPELGPALAVARDNVSVVVQVIAHHQARGSLADGPPLETMTALLGPLLVLGMVRQAEPDQPTFALDVAHHVSAFLRGRAAAPART